MSPKLSIREPLLDEETEAKLRVELSELWLSGMKGKDIAKKLHFGEYTLKVNGKRLWNPYANIRPEYVYFYRQKFAKKNPELFPIRHKPAFARNTPSANRTLRKTRYKVHPEEIGPAFVKVHFKIKNEEQKHS